MVADTHVSVVDKGRFASLPNPAARSDSSMVYAGSLSARQRFLCTLLFQCERSAASVSQYLECEVRGAILVKNKAAESHGWKRRTWRTRRSSAGLNPVCRNRGAAPLVPHGSSDQHGKVGVGYGGWGGAIHHQLVKVKHSAGPGRSYYHSSGETALDLII